MRKKVGLIVFLIVVIVFIFLGKNKLAVLYSHWGNNYYKQKLYKIAEENFLKSLKIDPAVVAVHYSLANTYLKEKLEVK